MPHSSSEEEKTPQKSEDLIKQIKVDEVDPKNIEKLAHNLPKHSFYTERKYVIDQSVGLILVDKKLISTQRGLGSFLIKKVGANFLSGKSIMNVSIPVSIFGPTTFLHHTVKDFEFAPYFLSKANTETDPIEKLSHVIAMVTASIHLNIPQLKPFNPVIGETLQAKIGDALVYCEQVCHHPPISAIQVYGNGYYIYGSLEYEIKMGPRRAKYSKKGYTYVILKDGTKYRITLPVTQINGILFGNRELLSVGDYTIEDMTNKIYSRVRIYPEKRGFFKSIFVKQKERKDHIK